MTIRIILIKSHRHHAAQQYLNNIEYDDFEIKWLKCIKHIINNPCGKLNAERARTWSSCAAHSTKATRTVRETLLQQSLAGNKCYRAGERITEPDCQGGEGRAGNNRQSKKKNKKNDTIRIRLYYGRPRESKRIWK